MFICFLALFSLDVFQPGLGFWQIALGLFIHNIPALVLSVVLLISWKYEIVGGIGFIFAGVFYIVMLLGHFEWYMLSWILTISGPAFLVGVLFFASWFQKKNNV